MSLQVPDLYYVGNIDTNFIGFSFNGVHSFELGVIRVSEGSRYEENLLPSFKDQTLEAPGRDGLYYFKQNFSQKEIKLSFAFDRVTEQQLRKIKQWFNVDSPKELVFDETPYKYYLMKPKAPPTIKYLCFEEKKDTRIYKGEGTVQLVSYYPYGFSFVLDYENELFKYTGNKIEWQDSSGLVKHYDSNLALNGSKKMYNGGDFKTPLYITIKPENPTKQISILCTLNSKEQLLIDNLLLKGDDSTIRINARNQLLEGGKGMGEVFTPSGYIYNEYVEGIFPSLPLGDSSLTCSGVENVTEIQVTYNLLYL